MNRMIVSITAASQSVRICRRRNARAVAGSVKLIDLVLVLAGLADTKNNSLSESGEQAIFIKLGELAPH